MSPEQVAALLSDRMDLRVLPCEAERLSRYLDLLLQWNARMNLTAIREPETIVLRHFGESLLCARILQLQAGATLLDYGSGAGFPGMVCAIARPQAQVTLAESQGKKAAFLREAARVLALGQVRVHAGRVDALPLHSRFSVVTLRAVDRMEEACRLALERLDRRGRIVVLTTLQALAKIQASTGSVCWGEPIFFEASRQRLLLTGTSRETE